MKMAGSVKTLLAPRALSFKNRILYSGRTRLILFGGIGLVLWVSVFAGSFRVLLYFKSIEDLGDILAHKLLSMVFVVIMSLLAFSSIIILLSKLYLSRDLDLVHSLPVPQRHIFFARWIEATIDSSWMVIAFVLPVFLSYGLAYRTGPLFYAASLVFLLLLCVTASAASAIGVALIVNLVSASRLKTVFMFLGLVLFILLYMAFRMARPERLVDPEMFATTLAYLRSLNTPSSPWLPSTWAYEGARAAMDGETKGFLFNLATSLSCAGALVAFMLMTAEAVYFKGFSKSAAGRTGAVAGSGKGGSAGIVEFIVPGFVPRHARAFFIKEIKTFIRDQSQWSQLFLIAALVVIYLYNFKVLPLEKAPIPTVYLQNLFSFLNVGLASFVLAAVTARFAFPAVSMEKWGFWIVRCAPVSIRSFLLIKYVVYSVPLVLLTLVLIVVSNILLHVSDFMMAVSVATVALTAPVIVAMGVGIGAIYPDFSSENPAQAVSSFGGVVFMATSALYVMAVIALEAGPVYRLFMAGLRGRTPTAGEWLWAGATVAVVLAVSAFAAIFPLVLGERRLAGN